MGRCSLSYGLDTSLYQCAGSTTGTLNVHSAENVVFLRGGGALAAPRYS